MEVYKARGWEMTEKIAFILIGGGALAATGFLLWWFITAPDISLFWKITMGIVIVGLFLLLVVAGWERYRASKGKEKDFKEVRY